METKKPKKYKCGLCNKQYCFVYWAYLHNKKKHKGKATFKDLKGGEFGFIKNWEKK